MTRSRSNSKMGVVLTSNKQKHRSRSVPKEFSLLKKVDNRWTVLAKIW